MMAIQQVREYLGGGPRAYVGNLDAQHIAQTPAFLTVVKLPAVLRIYARCEIEYTRQSACRITLAVLKYHGGGPVAKDGIADNQSRVRTHEQGGGAHFDG